MLQAFDPNEWCLKNDLFSGGLNTWPLSHKSFALTTNHCCSPWQSNISKMMIWYKMPTFVYFSLMAKNAIMKELIKLTISFYSYSILILFFCKNLLLVLIKTNIKHFWVKTKNAFLHFWIVSVFGNFFFYHFWRFRRSSIIVWLEHIWWPLNLCMNHHFQVNSDK